MLRSMVRVFSTRFLGCWFYPQKMLPLTVSPEESNGHIKAISKDAAHHEHERFVTFAMAVSEEMEPHLQLAEQDIGTFTSVIR